MPVNSFSQENNQAHLNKNTPRHRTLTHIVKTSKLTTHNRSVSILRKLHLKYGHANLNSQTKDYNTKLKS